MRILRVLFIWVVVILLYVDDVVLLSKLRLGLQRLMNKLSELCTFSSLDV